jgi:hypothetical protein
MEQASKAAKENQLSRAGGQQQQAGQTMQQMQGAVDQQQQERQEMLRRRLKKLAQLIQQLIDSQKRQRQALGNQAQDAIAQLAPGQSQLRRRTMAAQQHAQRNEQTQPAAAPLGKAVNAQGEALKALRQGDAKPADTAEADAVRHLEAALKQIRQAQQKQQKKEQAQQREKLRQQYKKLAQQQRTVLKQTQPLVDQPQLNRKQQATLRDLGDQQQTLRKQLTDLKKRVEKTLVFQRMHQQVDGAMQRIAESLNEGEATEPTLADQQFTVRMLEAMAEALKREPGDNDFAGRQGGGSGGGGGGQGGGQQSPVPPYAELKLLRAGQAAVAERTAQLAEARDQGSEPAKQRLRELSGRQQGLAELGQNLLKQMKQRQGQQQRRRHQRQGQ